MGDKFAGKWKLANAKNWEEFAKAINTSAEEIEKYKFMMDPANDIFYDVKIVGDSFDQIHYMGDKELSRESGQFNVERCFDYDGLNYKVLTKLEGGSLVDIANRDGLKEARYKRTVTGNKMICEMTGGGVTALTEFVKM